jgi:glycerophosphoryl diester phosphodiesterase
MFRPLHAGVAVGAALAVLVIGLAAPAGAANRWLGQRVANFAHQGGEDELPSNTLYAYKTALRRGADWLELDVGYTNDGRLVILHDNKVDRTTNGAGSVNDMSLAQVQALDAAHWFVPGRNAVKGLPDSRYPLRGVRTGAKRPPRGFTRNDFRVPSLEEVLRAFPRTPINIEIKGRDGAENAVFLRGAELLAAVLNRTRRTDIIVASFNQLAIDRFHQLAPRVPLAPGIDGTARWLFGNASPGDGVVAFQVPITFRFGGQLLTIASPDFVRRAHEDGYAVHVWLSNDREDLATYRKLLSWCVDGIMAGRPAFLARHLASRKVPGPGDAGNDPCGTRVAVRIARASGGKVTLPLARRGLSLERRSGTVTLRLARRFGALRRNARVGTGRFALRSGETRTTTDVRLSAAVLARARASGGGLMQLVAYGNQLGRVVSRSPLTVVL